MLLFSIVVNKYQSDLGYEGILWLTGLASFIAYLLLIGFLEEKPFQYSNTQNDDDDYNYADEYYDQYSLPEMCSFEFSATSTAIRKYS